jgi:hypothetical protein
MQPPAIPPIFLPVLRRQPACCYVVSVHALLIAALLTPPNRSGDSSRHPPLAGSPCVPQDTVAATAQHGTLPYPVLSARSQGTESPTTGVFAFPDGRLIRAEKAAAKNFEKVVTPLALLFGMDGVSLLPWKPGNKDLFPGRKYYRICAIFGKKEKSWDEKRATS